MQIGRLARLLPAAALATALALAGCNGATDGEADSPSSSDSAGSPPATGSGADQAADDGSGPDPCTLLSVEEIETLAGVEVDRTEGPVDELLGRQCQWVYPHEQLGEGMAQVNVWVGEEFYSPNEPGGEVTDFEEVEDLGEAAHLWPETFGLCTVIVLQDGMVVQVSVDGGNDVCVELARTAVGRL